MWGPLQLARRAGLFQDDLSWHFSPGWKQVVLRQAVKSLGVVGLYTPTEPDFPGTLCPTRLREASKDEQQLQGTP